MPLVTTLPSHLAICYNLPALALRRQRYVPCLACAHPTTWMAFEGPPSWLHKHRVERHSTIVPFAPCLQDCSRFKPWHQPKKWYDL